MARSNLAACGSCSAPIRWLKTERAKPIPVDAHTASDADTLFQTSRGHISHFATCPFASKHSKRNAARESTPKRPRKKDPDQKQPDLGLYPPGYPLVITNVRAGVYGPDRPITPADSLDYDGEDFDDLSDLDTPHPEQRRSA